MPPGGVSSTAARQTAKQVGRATNAAPSTVEQMRVNHGGANVLVSEQFLHRADVVAAGKQVRSEGMPKGVAGHVFGKARSSDGRSDRLLNQGSIDVMPPLTTGLLVTPAALLRKHKLPAPLPTGIPERVNLFETPASWN